MQKWSKEEVLLLKENVDRNLITLKKLLPTKSEDEILEKIRLVYRTSTNNKYTEAELDIIKDNKNTTIVALMKLLPSRTFESIRHKKYTVHGYYSNETKKKWTDEEIAQVTKLTAEGYTNYEISGYIGRNIQSVMGLKYTRELTSIKRKSFDRFAWNPDNEKLIRETLSKNGTLDSVASLLDITLNKVYQKALSLGFKPCDILTDSKIMRQNKYNVVDKLSNELQDVRNSLKVAKAEIKLLKDSPKKGKK